MRASVLLLLPAALLGVAVVAAAPPPEDAAAALARAVALHQAGDLEGAVAAYRESLRLGPTAEAGSNLGAALAALGRYQEAIEAYRGALAAGAAGRPHPLQPRARVLQVGGPAARGGGAARRCTREQPDDARATLLLADCRLQLGEPAAVEALLRPLAAARPDDRAVTYLLGMALVRGGKVEEGQRLVETLIRDGDSAEAQYLVGSAAFMAGDYPQAVERFSRGARRRTRSCPSLRSYYGRALLFTGDADGAERAFREALADDPNDYEANYFLGSILETRGRPEEARPVRGEGRAPAAAVGRGEGRSSPRSTRPEAPRRPSTRSRRSSATPRPTSSLQRRRRPRASASPSLRGRPLVLMVGSYTCPQLRHGAPEVNRLYERHEATARLPAGLHPRGAPRRRGVAEHDQPREGVSLPEARSLRGARRARGAVPARAEDPVRGRARRTRRRGRGRVLRLPEPRVRDRRPAGR